MKILLALLVAAVIGVALILLFVVGPRMYVQPSIRAYQTRVAALPKGVVPVERRVELPSAAEAAALTNPLAATAENLARGKTYYGYYCAACHGAAGAGDGPVGQSYVPAPSNLVSGRVQSFTDGEILRAMLTGVGHEPVLERVVPAEHRWYTVLYVRSLGAPAAQP
jgi:mono/diheme cytochrome c family protein